MPENQTAKDEVRLKQCVSIVRAIISTFGEPTVLDALAIVVETPDGKELLRSAAEASREISRQDRSTGPGLLPVCEVQTTRGST